MLKQIENVKPKRTLVGTLSTLTELGILDREQIGKAFRTSQPSICRKFNEGGDFWSEDLRNAMSELPEEAVDAIRALFPLAKQPTFSIADLDTNRDGYCDEDDVLASAIQFGSMQQQTTEEALKLASSGSPSQEALIAIDVHIGRKIRALKKLRAQIANHGMKVPAVNLEQMSAALER